MSKTKTPVREWVLANLPQSAKVISEALNAEAFHIFAGEVQELQSRIEAQSQGNQLLKEDLEKEKLRAENAEQKITELNQSLNGIQLQLITAQADRDKYKEHYEAKAELGKKLPKEDSDSRKDPEQVYAADSPMGVAMAALARNTRV